MSGASSRWNRGKDLSWVLLRPERVCEVAYDHMQGDRFRHGAQFVRWRPDKPPEECRYDQLEVTPAYELERVFGARGTGRADEATASTPSASASATAPSPRAAARPRAARGGGRKPRQRS